MRFRKLHFWVSFIFLPSTGCLNQTLQPTPGISKAAAVTALLVLALDDAESCKNPSRESRQGLSVSVFVHDRLSSQTKWIGKSRNSEPSL